MRMYNYFSHLWLTHQKPIFPIALFSDDGNWTKSIPDHFEIKVGKIQILHFHYELVKLKALNWKDYLRTKNPAAVALMSKMGYKKEEMPRLKAEISRLFTTGKLRNHPKTAILANFVEYYLRLDKKQDIIFIEELRKLGIKKKEMEMILSPPFAKKLEEGKRLGKLENQRITVENMLKEGCEWGFIKKITGVTKRQYEKLEKMKIPPAI